MKNLRNIFLAVAAMFAFAACETDADTVSEVADEAGALVQVRATSNSSILGLPDGADLEVAEVAVTNAYLNMTISMTSGNLDKIEKFEIVKSFNGGTEVSLGETTTLPYNLVIDNLDALLAGTGVLDSDLRIGDVLSFRTKVHQNDGDAYYYNSGMGNYSMTVNCSSDIAGTYTNPAVPQTDYCFGDIIVTEDAPGRYFVSSMTNYTFGSGGCIGFYMVDVCGQLTYDGGDLEDNNYSGEGGTGLVNDDGFSFTCFLNETGYSELSQYTRID